MSLSNEVKGIEMDIRCKKVGFIGFGSMAGAVCDGLLAGKVVDPANIYACARDMDRLRAKCESRGINACSGADDTAAASDIVVIGVLPHQVEAVVKNAAESLRGKPILSIAGIPATFTGRGKLPERPMDVYYRLFDQQGIAYQTRNGKLPLTVTGRLSGGQICIDGSVSSQFVTGLLMALPLAKEDSVLTISGTFASRPYVDLTLGMSRRFGIRIDEKDDHTFVIKGNQTYRAANLSVEADASQAAFMAAAGLIAAGDQGLMIEGLDPETRQGDLAFLKFAASMGGHIEWTEKGLKVKRSDLRGDHVFDCENCPDIVPILAVLAAYDHGTVTITHAERLRIKESDRLQAMTEEMTKAGAAIEQTPDGLIIKGGRPLQGGTVQAWNDHRIAMSMAVAALGSREGITIRGAECISKSWPTFFEDLAAVTQ